MSVVTKQAKQAGIGTPEVGIFQSDTVNAFATGMSRNNSLIAVSTGLLQKMSADEAEAVLGHEVRARPERRTRSGRRSSVVVRVSPRRKIR